MHSVFRHISKRRRCCRLETAEHFALRSLDRILAEGWHEDQLLHVLAYSDANTEHRQIPGMLDDYAFTAVACLDAYEATADLSYFNFARRIADAMVEQFFDPVSGGFFDTGKASSDEKALGVLGTRRKPFQDSPTPAGNSVAAIALLRLTLTPTTQSLRDKAEQTIELIAGLAGQYGLFAATYGIAAVHLSHAHTQIVIVGNDELADHLYSAAVAPYSASKAVLRLAANKAVPQNLPLVASRNDSAITGDPRRKNRSRRLFWIHLSTPDLQSGRTDAMLAATFADRPLIQSRAFREKKRLTIASAIASLLNSKPA